jgi:hypothetical protein
MTANFNAGASSVPRIPNYNFTANVPENHSSAATRPYGQLPAGICIAGDSATRAAIYRLRYAVYVEEQGKALSAADHRRRELTDAHDQTALHLYMQAEGQGHRVHENACGDHSR